VNEFPLLRRGCPRGGESFRSPLNAMRIGASRIPEWAVVDAAQAGTEIAPQPQEELMGSLLDARELRGCFGSKRPACPDRTAGKGGEFMSADEGVRKASEQFYGALNTMLNGDAGPLAAIWSHGPDVTTMHPIGGREVGWDQGRGAWANVAEVATDGKVRIKDQLVQVAGDVAYEVGIEQGQFKLGGHLVTVEGRVTNIYRREAGAWKIIHHHADIAPAMVDALQRLQLASGKARP